MPKKRTTTIAALTGTQIRMARAAIRWTMQDLADRAGVHVATIQRLEQDDGPPATSPRTLTRIAHAFQDHGFKFRPQDDRTGPAVAAPRIRVSA